MDGGENLELCANPMIQRSLISCWSMTYSWPSILYLMKTSLLLLSKSLLVDTDKVDIDIIYIRYRLRLNCFTIWLWFHLHYANASYFNLEHIDFIMCINLENLQVRAPGDPAGAHTWRPCRCTHLKVNLHWKLKLNVSDIGFKKIKIIQNHYAIAILAMSQPFQVPS